MTSKNRDINAVPSDNGEVASFPSDKYCMEVNGRVHCSPGLFAFGTILRMLLLCILGSSDIAAAGKLLA